MSFLFILATNKLSRLSGRQPRRKEFLLGLALDFLREIIAHTKPHGEFFAAITVLDNKDFDQIVPNVFVCHGKVRQRFATYAFAGHPHRLESSLTAIINRLDRKGEFQVLEDTLTVPDHVRVFIGYRRTLGNALGQHHIGTAGVKAAWHSLKECHGSMAGVREALAAAQQMKGMK